MAGTIEGITLCLMVIAMLTFTAVRTGDPVWWLMVVVGAIALGAHFAIMVRDRKLSQPTVDESSPDESSK